MILPTKRISQDRALLGIGATVLQMLEEPKTVSRLWDEMRQASIARIGAPKITYDWFVLSLDLLYSFGVIELERGKLRRISR